MNEAAQTCPVFGQVEAEASRRALCGRWDATCTWKAGRVSTCETRRDEENTGAGQSRACSEDKEKISWPGLGGRGERRSIKSGSRMFGAQIMGDQATEFQVFKVLPHSLLGLSELGYQ